MANNRVWPPLASCDTGIYVACLAPDAAGSADGLNPLVKRCLGEPIVRRVTGAHHTNGAQISHMLKEDRPSVRQSHWFCLLNDERWNDASSE